MINKLFKVWPLLLCMVIFSSCSRYQYATVSSPLKQTYKHEFIRENDSIRVVYNFNGEGGPVNIAVHNKLDTPMFVNWRLSSLIIAGQSKSYFDNNSVMHGSSTSTEIDWGRGLSTTSSSFSGTMKRDDDVSYIPPGRYITATPASLKSNFFKHDPSVKPIRKSYNSVSGPASGRSYAFTMNNSPLSYQSYLSYSTHANFANIATVEDNFWVSEILETHGKPNTILNMEDRQADTFYNSKLTGFGGFMVGAAVVVLVVIRSVQQ